MKYLRISMLFSTAILLLTAPFFSVFAENIFERVSNTIEKTVSPKNDSSPPTQKDNIQRASIPKDLPAHWKLSIINESVFGADILTAEVGDNTKPVIFLVHGLGQLGMRDWLTVVPSLENDYFVVLLDLPGFASSAKPIGRYSPSNYAKVLAELKQKFSPSAPIIVVGHSMGGAVSLRYSHLFPTHIKKLILVDAAGILEKTAFIKHTAKIPIFNDNTPKLITRLLGKAQNTSSNFIEIINSLPDPTNYVSSDTHWGKMFFGKTNINAAFALVAEDFSSAIYSNTVATGIIWGENDPVAPLRTGKVLEKNLSSAVLKIIPDAGHTPMKSYPEIFNKHLHALLSAKPKPSPIDNSRQKGLTCTNESNKTYTGVYSSISINNCSNIMLTSINTGSISISDSTVTLENVDVYSDKTGLSIKDSVVTATNLNVYSQEGMILDESRLDIAGSYIHALTYAIQVKEKSKIIFSVSRIYDKTQSVNVHGIFSLKKEYFRGSK